MTLKLEHTNRGFGRIEFRDRYGYDCSIQASSLATEDAIWFGVAGNRMHLTRERVSELLPVLQHFARTGELRDAGFLASERDWVDESIRVSLSPDTSMSFDIATAEGHALGHVHISRVVRLVAIVERHGRYEQVDVLSLLPRSPA